MKFLRVLGVTGPLVLSAIAGPATAQSPVPYPDIADVSHSSSSVADWFRAFFTAKSNHQPEVMTDNFSKNHILYIDTTLGWSWKSYQELKDLFDKYMPMWAASGKSYPTLVLGDDKSALVAFTDTPELFGGELRILGAVDFEDGKVVRWMDYWDARPYGIAAFDKIKTPDEKYPAEFGEKAVGEQGSAKIRDIAKSLSAALAAGDTEAASKLFSYDAVLVDLGLRTHIAGRSAIAHYLARSNGKVPYGKGSSLRHVVGADGGGGYEWVPAAGAPARLGITALTLDPNGQITQLLTVWDTSQLSDEQMRTLVALSFDP